MINARMADLIDNSEQDDFDELNIQIERYDRFFAGQDPFTEEGRMNCYKVIERFYEPPKRKKELFKEILRVRYDPHGSFDPGDVIIHHDAGINLPVVIHHGPINLPEGVDI